MAQIVKKARLVKREVESAESAPKTDGEPNESPPKTDGEPKADGQLKQSAPKTEGELFTLLFCLAIGIIDCPHSSTVCITGIINCCSFFRCLFRKRKTDYGFFFFLLQPWNFLLSIELLVLAPIKRFSSHLPFGELYYTEIYYQKCSMVVL